MDMLNSLSSEDWLTIYAIAIPSILALLAVIYWGGSTHQKVRDLERRVTKLEDENKELSKLRETINLWKEDAVLIKGFIFQTAQGKQKTPKKR